MDPTALSPAFQSNGEALALAGSTSEGLLGRLKTVRRCGSGWQACCPAHEDHKPSLSIRVTKTGHILLKCHAGCPVENIVAALGLTMADLFPSRADSRGNRKARVVETYDYTDERGALLFQCVRYEPKDFKQRRPDPRQLGEWVWNLSGVPRVLYRLPEILAVVNAGGTVFVAEGEKDVQALARHNFAATCNPMGAGKWLPKHTEALRGAARVVVVADKDETGRKHAQGVARALRAVAPSVKLIELPDVNGKPVKDAADFFAVGGTAAGLGSIVEAAPEFVPKAEAQPREPGNCESEYPNEDDSGDEDSPKPRESAATRLVKLAAQFEFFHDPQNRGFVRLDVNRHLEVWPLNSSQFRKLLAQTFYKRTHSVVNRNALADAIATLEGRALFESREEPVFLRVAPHGENILVDLCDPQWRVVEVTAKGWRILESSPVSFIRSPAMRPLPVPVSGSEGSLNPLWELLNISPALRPLVADALLNGFHPHGPYFVPNYIGEQGSAKSCAAKIHRLLIDPNENPLRSPPREERDLLVHAANNWCVALDNLSGVPPWLSDGICRLATGGGHSARQLFTDGEEFSVAVKRPVILNGIEDVATRPDLAERALQIELETIPDNRRIPEKELWLKFEQARPVIFSGVLNGLVCGLRELPNVKLDCLPRMADAALFATAAETAFGWSTGTFMSAYWNNLNEGASASVDAHPVGVGVRRLLDGLSEWSGEPTQLLTELNNIASDELRRAHNWPKTPRALSACLRRMAQAFRRAGIGLDFARSKRRGIRLCKQADSASPASPASPESTPAGADDANDANLLPLHDSKPADAPKGKSELTL